MTNLSDQKTRDAKGKGKSSLKTAHNKLDTQQQQQQQRKGLRVKTIKKRSARVCVCFL